MAVAEKGKPEVNYLEGAITKKAAPKDRLCFSLAAGALRADAKQDLAFRELEALARLCLAVFLALDDAAVAGQIAFGLDCAAQRGLIF